MNRYFFGSLFLWRSQGLELPAGRSGGNLCASWYLCLKRKDAIMFSGFSGKKSTFYGNSVFFSVVIVKVLTFSQKNHYFNEPIYAINQR